MGEWYLMFALAAAVVAILAILTDISRADLLWWWLGFIALQFAFGWGLPFAGPSWGRKQ
jgi:hypothetical protein